METKARHHKRVQAAIAALEKHDCRPSCDGVPEAALAILKTST